MARAIAHLGGLHDRYNPRGLTDEGSRIVRDSAADQGLGRSMARSFSKAMKTPPRIVT